ncbi:AT-rich interactive domain-containing protein 2-like isoform X2 [Prosopis cineraria]|uniref:AT-rich interactive domain-containing protein 2-like isoform X2 n=1 Tax=Prosopis cineraria TaxID=364024 RepID=UPI0024107BA1|nr:AT-rich interactive domain-containing protein 2-like isoform X2 [Prosopis cineraria]
MARWSSFTNGSSEDCLETVGGHQGNDCCFDVGRVIRDQLDDEVKLKCLFHQLLSIYIKENNSGGNIRPVPVMLGDGQSLDLYKLFSFVNKRGGYALVSKKGLWGSVTKELHLNPKLLASVKLVYDKYLNEFEGWLGKARGGKNFKSGNHGCDMDFKSVPSELVKEFRDALCGNARLKDDVSVQLQSHKTRNYIDLIDHEGEMNLPDNKNQPTICENVHSILGDANLKLSDGVKDDLASLNSEVPVKESNSRKRKREALSSMLNWIRRIAKYPHDPSIEPIPEASKWKEYKGQDFWVQILRAREALRLRSCDKPKCVQPSMQKQKMHPAMYEDHAAVSRRSTAKLRWSKRLPTSVKSQICSCCNSHSAIENKLPCAATTEEENASLEKTTAADGLLSAKETANSSTDDTVEKQVAIGPLFQAEVPKWTGVVSESDSKWLGTQVWPLKDRELQSVTETGIIGRGRQETCSCKVQGSVECVRFHIAEMRMKLKLDLGSAFYQWGFDCMGEEVSLQWTAEEEKKFKDIMMLNLPSQNKSNPFKYFPKKKRRSLVSYYFNVFLIQRRIYQNRVTPSSVDSDDDEHEFGSFTDGFGMEAVKGPGYKFLECSQNNRCTELE